MTDPEDMYISARHRTKGTKETIEKARLVMESAPTPCDEIRAANEYLDLMPWNFHLAAMCGLLWAMTWGKTLHWEVVE